MPPAEGVPSLAKPARWPRPAGPKSTMATMRSGENSADATVANYRTSLTGDR
jgi:hypothetical protein